MVSRSKNDELMCRKLTTELLVPDKQSIQAAFRKGGLVIESSSTKIFYGNKRNNDTNFNQLGDVVTPFDSRQSNSRQKF